MPKRFEYAYNMESVVSLNGCKDSEGGLEIGLSLPMNKMDVFTVIFAEGLRWGIESPKKIKKAE